MKQVVNPSLKELKQALGDQYQICYIDMEKMCFIEISAMVSMWKSAESAGQTRTALQRSTFGLAPQ